MAETKNLYQKLLSITEEIGKIGKTGRNTTQGYSFIEQAQVVAEVRVQLAKHGVMIIPETVGRTLTQVTSSKGTPMTQASVVSRYTLVNADDPTDRMVCEWDAGEALDTSDKATNKAVTASDKYFKMKLFNISDKDDPDQDSPETPKTAPAKAWVNPRAGAMSTRATVTPPPDDFMPPDLPITPAATSAERIHPTTVTRLGGALQLKGITDQAMRKEILDAIAVRDFDSFGFTDMNETDAQLLLKKLSAPTVKQEDLLALLPPVN